MLHRRKARSNFLGYHGYPAVICASRNDVVVHGIPDGQVLAEGDIISIDCGAIVDGYHGDAAFTAGVGEISRRGPAPDRRDPPRPRRRDRRSCCPGPGWATWGPRCKSTVERAGFRVVRDYVGHGIGTAMHEPPDVPNVGRRGRGRRVAAGDVYAVEPMVSAGSDDTVVLADGWTVVTTDGARAAHWEHTVAVTEDGPEILTLP